MYRNPSEPVPESAVSPWMASILLRRGGSAWQRFALTYHQLAAMPRRWRRQLRRKAAVGLGSAALVLALAGPIMAAPARQPAAPDATIVVVNGEVANVNNNKCGLIEAILNARTSNANGMRPDCASGNVNGPDTISLPTNGEFILTQAHNSQFYSTGLPVITSAVTIEGHGASICRSTVSGTPNFRILAVDSNGALTLNDTGICSGASEYHGGGIYALGQLTLNDSTVSHNATVNHIGLGGGIFANGPLTITNSMIADNRTDTTFDVGYGPGGGIFIGEQSQATITGSTIIGNVAQGGYWASGGGIYVDGQATIINSTISQNASFGDESSALGGGIAVGGQATISGSLIVDNTVESFYEYFSNTDWPGQGGGLGNRGTTLIVNSTISSNEATQGGGVANVRFGELTIVQSTITGNENGGIFAGEHYRLDNCSTTTLRGALVSGNVGAIGSQIVFEPTPAGEIECYYNGPQTATMVVNAFNVFGQSNNAGVSGFSPGATDIVPAVGLSAILSPLGSNGGPTATHALPANSPALDRAPNASCTAAPVNGVDQRGEPRNRNAVGGVTNNECDVGAFERAGSAAAMGFYLSATNGGTVGDVSFAPGDIIQFTPAGGWAMHFDASDVGITKNVSAFEIEGNGHILLSLAAPQNVPGVGNVAAQDVLRFTPTSTGNTTAGSFTLVLDGSANLLTTSGEKIDALGLNSSGHLAISTVGAAAVKTPQNTVLKAQDEDALGFNLSTSDWFDLFNGTAIPGLKAEDVNALWIDPVTGDLYISIVGAFNLGGVAGNGRDIVKLTFDVNAPNPFTPSLFWDGSANGFPTNIDGLEMIP